MNEHTRQLVVMVLQMDEVWDKKTRELRYGVALDAMYQIHSAMFTRDVQMPLLQRAVHLCKILTDLPEDAYQIIESEGQEEEWFIDDCLIDRFTGSGDTWISYIASLWHGTYFWAKDLSFEVPSKEQILALNIRPNLVPPKKQQPSLF